MYCNCVLVAACRGDICVYFWQSLITFFNWLSENKTPPISLCTAYTKKETLFTCSLHKHVCTQECVLINWSPKIRQQRNEVQMWRGGRKPCPATETWVQIQFPPTARSHSGETKATKPSSQFSKMFNHNKFQRTLSVSSTLYKKLGSYRPGELRKRGWKWCIFAQWVLFVLCD